MIREVNSSERELKDIRFRDNRFCATGDPWGKPAGLHTSSGAASFCDLILID